MGVYLCTMLLTFALSYLIVVLMLVAHDSCYRGFGFAVVGHGFHPLLTELPVVY